MIGGGVRSTRPAVYAATNTFHQRRQIQPTIVSSTYTTLAGRQTRSIVVPPCITRQQQHCYIRPPTQLLQPHYTLAQQRQLSSSRRSNKSNRGSKNKKVDDNAPLLNEHLIAELFNKMNRREKINGNISADTYEVRLIVDQGRNKNKNGEKNDESTEEKINGEKEEGEIEDSNSASEVTPTNQVVTLNRAMTIAHEHSLDLMEVTLQQSPPVIKAVDFDKWLYEQKKKEKLDAAKKRKGEGGAISDRPLKEFKFRAGIADHDLQRKTDNMLKYLGKGHAIRVTLIARQRILNVDAAAIETTFERVKELVGDRAVEVRGMKANERKSYGSLLLHPSKTK